MGCDDVKRIASFYVDGTLDEKRHGAIKEHLDGCTECHCRVTVDRRLRDFVRKRLLRQVAPSRLRDKILALFRPGRADSPGSVG